MFVLNDDLSIHVTRGDIVFFSVKAEQNGETYTFKAGDVMRIKVFGKKNAEKVVLQKDFPIVADCTEVEIFLDEKDTKIGGIINKPTDYWYEVELNPLSDPQTIIGYDEDGPKIFRLLPEGADMPEDEPNIKPEDIPFIDDELDLTSPRPVQNQAAARAIVQLETLVKAKTGTAEAKVSELERKLNVESAKVGALATLSDGSTTGDAELIAARVGYSGNMHGNLGDAIRNQVRYIVDNIDEICNGDNINVFWRYALDQNIGNALKFDTGEVISTNNNYAYSDYIPVVPGQKVTIYEPEPAGNCVTMMGAYYDEGKTLIRGMGYHPNYQSGNPAEITIPEDVYYIRINYHLACANETAVIPHKLLPWHATGGSSVGKVWCCVGDSLTEANARASRHYYDYIADELGLTVLNYGISGTGYKNGSFANRIYGSIKEDFDIMTVFGSFNDLDASWELGNITDNGRDTLFGCMNAAVENFLIKYPTKKLALITPTPWKLGVEYFGVETTLENMEAYVNAILAVAKRHRVPCLDLYHCSGLNPDNSVVLTTYYNENGTQDLGVHPNSEGHKFIAPIIREFIKTLV